MESVIVLVEQMKLRGKLLVSLAAVILFMGLFQSFFLQSRVEKTFENYLSESDQMRIEMIKQNIISYYETFGSLEGIDRILDDSINGQNYGMGMGMGRMMGHMSGTSFGVIVKDASGNVMANTAKNISVNSIKQELIINGKTIGTINVYPTKNSSIERLEQQFVHSVKLAILLGFFFAGIISLIIGYFLSRKITKPLSQLMSGIENVARGNTDYRVAINSKDEFHQLGEAFNQMTNTLERTERVRKTLVADVAHELRTPLSIIGAKLESIQTGALEPTEEVILQLSDEVYRLSRLVSDLQQLSQAESGSLKLHKKNTEVNKLLEVIIEKFQWLADEKNISLQLSRSPEELFIEIDTDRITQVAVNLLGNALRYTPNRGVVTVIVKNEKHHISISFSDTGCGIEPEKLPFIFERFFRADEARNRDDGGTGLGLSIAKGYVEIHGGEIKVNSIIGKGTIFEVILPK
ncbi:MAG: integral rane sensor signal transduction histidine kinase [Bacillales bacterium]|jgi:two-component system sensor histidine kinase BaeS|nr:integral rane sensor signal transduction histidine kinase [Bacillales bacterium]